MRPGPDRSVTVLRHWSDWPCQTPAEAGRLPPMADARRYEDQEVRRIFDLATRGDGPGAPPLLSPEGLTLSELQDVGREVGLEPDRIAHAALVLDAGREVLPRGTSLGMPTSVGRTVQLPRPVTDREWELLISELRETFGAKGRVTSHGGLREWSNGNLHAFVEPTETGHRLRLTTFKSSAMAVNAMGAGMIAFALMILIVLLGKGDPGGRFVVPLFFSLFGGGLLASNVVGLPRWADERERQMEYIANRAKALLGAPLRDDDPTVRGRPESGEDPTR